jgi:choline dehydrogenase-like flavoprotein
VAFDCDIIVVGSGAGGGTFAAACARQGKSVLLLERGKSFPPAQLPHDERAMLIDRQPYDDRKFDVNGTERRLYMGGVLGGSTALYGAVLLRPSTDDFHPGRHYSRFLPRTEWDWPVGYEDLEPDYTAAEALYGVSGSATEDFGPLPRPKDGFPQPGLPLHSVNQKVAEANRKVGLRPFQLPLAIDFARCLRCGVCPGYICPNGSRHSSAGLLEVPGLRILTDVEVERLALDSTGNPDGVCAIDRATGQSTMYRARRYVLAAGALGSPLILLKSGIAHRLIGRHYMMHLSPIVVGLFPRRLDAEEGFVKQLGFSDYYFGSREFPHKMGLVQSLPVPGPLMLAKAAPRFLPARLLAFLRRRMLPLVGIIEDLPDPANRVTWGENGRPTLHHRFSAFDLERGKQLARLIGQIVKRAGAVYALKSQFASDEHVAHQCGTLRFGTDPAHAVLDRDCRMFGHPNVFVVDGSFMPTSLGVGPALTIIANALRVARIVSREV